MRKIPTLFVRSERDRKLVTPEVTPGCEWVLAGEGVATRKYDGVCCMFNGQTWFKRRELKAGQPQPADFMPVQHDEITGKNVGWMPIGDGPEDKYMREAAEYTYRNICMKHHEELGVKPATCEFLGPKSQGNIERMSTHGMLFHKNAEQYNAPRSFDELKEWLTGKDIEGLVFRHEDGRMAKIKLRDFGLKRGQVQGS